MATINASGRGLVSLSLLLICVGLLATPSPLAAQSQAGTGQIVGTVFDESGAVVPGATVTAVNKDTGLTREIETSEAGEYRLVLLPPGRYTLTVKRTGFKAAQSDVLVNVGATVTLNATLGVGQVTEVVEVTASAMINTTRPEADALINVESLTNLPIVGRRFHDFITLAPTVQVDPQRSQLSFAGQRGINGNITIDGADYNELFFGGMRAGERAGNAFSIPQESIAEFQVIPYGYSAEFGRSTGGFVNAITRSGTNNWHGSAFYFLRHKELARKDALNRQALDSLHQFGGAIGGPIRRDKSFLHFAIEDQINDNPRIVRFTRLDGITGTGPIAEAFDFYKSLEAPFTQSNDAITFLGRWDHNFTSNHRLALRYHYSKNDAKNAVATGEAISPITNNSLSNNGTEGDRTNTVAGQLTSFFSPRLINELRAQYSREERPRSANARQSGVGNLIGNYGTRSFLPTTLFDWRLQFAENLTWNKGRHSFKMGGEFNHLFVDQFFMFNQFGSSSISGSDVRTLLAIMSVGRDPAISGDVANRLDSPAVTYRVAIGNGELQATMRQVALFAQDAWRITPRFTLTYGFRWEGYFNPEPATSNTTLTETVRNFTFPLGKVDPGLITDNTDQWMPRIGWAWDPAGNGKTVIRSSAGIYYAHTPLLLLAGPLNNFRTPPGDLSVTLPLSGAPATCRTVYCQMLRAGIDMNTTPLDKLPTLTLAQIQSIATSLGLTIDLNRGLGPLTWANDYESPRSWQWSAGAEHEVVRSWTVGADFAYVNTVHLQRNRDWNVPLPVIPATDRSLRPCFGLRGGTACSTRDRPVPSLFNVTVRESASRSFYRAVSFRSVLRRTRYQFQAYYTLSKNTSYDDNERDATGQRMENIYDLSNEYSFSDIDVRHLLAFSGVVDLPWGITVGGSTRLSSARPFSPSTGADTNGDFGGPDRPYQAPGVPFKRNSFRDRPFNNVNVRVTKRIKLPREGMAIDLTYDFFNLFNFDNVQYGSSNQIFGLGINPATGNPAPIDTRFKRLRNPAACFPANPNGNPGCYDTSNNPGRPFTMQLGIRFSF